MILLEIRNYLQQHGYASLRNLSEHFTAEPEAVRAMLAHLIRKGQVNKVANPHEHCGGCTQCDPLSLEIYRWGDAKMVTDGHRQEQPINFIKCT